MYQFGSGDLIAIPSSSGSAAPTNPTPIMFGTLQDVSLDIQGSLKELFGKNQFPVAVARTETKITGKAKFASINGKLFNDVYFGSAGTISPHATYTAIDESGTPSTSTITVSHSATFTVDLGVKYSATGVPLTKVSSAPSAGQYSVSAGVYTFNAADTGAMLISYEYTQTVNGSSIAIVNTAMGNQPTFALKLNQKFGQTGNQLGIYLYSCVAGKLSLPTKLQDFMIPEFDFSAFANASGQVIRIDTDE